METPCVAFGAFPRGDDTFAAGRPLLGVPGLGRARVTGACFDPPRGCAMAGSRIASCFLLQVKVWACGG
ncbi:hypothetical protein DBV10_09120 [Acidovorax sp. FJL06]|nr:hypothetical protein DBV10_09120 [Acidovorax sp. FJL06]